jgi:penicillin-insensitive murein DD-endopeptidase
MERKIVLLPLLAFLFVSCSQNGFHEPLASLKNETATTTYSPPAPTAKLVNGVKVVDGLSAPGNFAFDLDGKTAKATLKGSITIKAVGEAPINVPIEVDGNIDADSLHGVMPAKNADQLTAMGIRSGASITCLNTSCTESFIDVYVVYKGYVYHHQLQVSGKNVNKEEDRVATPDTSGDDDAKAPKAKDHKPVKPAAPPAKKPNAPLGQAGSEEDDGSQYEHDIDDDGEAGTYVGSPVDDIEAMFPDLGTPKNKPAPKTSQKDPSKKEDPAKTDSSSGKRDKKDEAPSSAQPAKPGLMDRVKAVLKGLGQAVTGVGKNNFTRGYLENAANVYDYQQNHQNVGFQILYPKRETFYSTDDMRNVLVSLGQYNQKFMNGYVTCIGDISKKGGGPLGTHSSHQMGLDADISYYFDDQSKQKGLVDAVASSKPIRAFMADEQWAMFKALVAQGNVDRIFIHPALKKELCNVANRNGDIKAGAAEGVPFETLRILRPESNHDNHFHLRLKCSMAQPRCRQMAPPAKATGC